MVGPFKRSLIGGNTHLLIAVKKFTKWIEARPIRSLDAWTAINFVRCIIFLFGVPHSIIADNSLNCTAEEFQEFYVEQGI